MHSKTTCCDHPWLMHSSQWQKAIRLGKSGCASFKAIPMGWLKETERSSLEILNLCLLLPFVAVFRPKHLITSLFSQPCNEKVLPSSLFSWDDCQIGVSEGEFKTLELSSFLLSSVFWGFFLALGGYVKRHERVMSHKLCHR